jgi:very-short-patch-repair endonuclease
VEIAGVGRVDFVIGDRLVVEVDSEQYHTDPAKYEGDRRRDAALSILGLRVLRFSYHQIMDEWSTVDRAVMAAVARGDA